MTDRSAAIQRVEATPQRLERLERVPSAPERKAAAPEASPGTDSPDFSPNAGKNLGGQPPKAAVLQRLRTMQAEGFSLQAVVHRFNLEGVPTLSGKGRWQKGTIGKLLRALHNAVEDEKAER
jgi:hypothetical protein